jgi:hypothetical protein
VALTPKTAAGGSAKHALTYSPSFDPILDPPLFRYHILFSVATYAGFQINLK